MIEATALWFITTQHCLRQKSITFNVASLDYQPNLSNQNIFNFRQTRGQIFMA